MEYVHIIWLSLYTSNFDEMGLLFAKIVIQCQ